MKTLHKKENGALLTVAGHFNRQEIKVLLREGWRFPKKSELQMNRHGIPVGGRERRA